MTEPTKEEYKALADILGDARGRRVGVSLYGDNLLTAYKAFRLAANMPSEEELLSIGFNAASHAWLDGDTAGQVKAAARAIVARIEDGVK